MTRTVLTTLIAVGLTVAGSAQVPTKLDLGGLLDAYATGRRDEAVAQAAALPDLGPFRLRYVQDSPVWVNADPARREARSAAAAAFLLEVTAARLDSDWGRLSDLIEWTCMQLRTTGPPTEFERAWHAASHALAGRARPRLWLLGQVPRLAHQPPARERPMNAKEVQAPPPAHLMHALERFPDEPQFQLSRVVAWTWGRDGEPTRNVRRRDEGDDRRRQTRAPQLEAVTALAPLTSVPEVAAEAWIRTGRVRFTVNDFAGALSAFEQAQPIATETAMKYLAHFEAGRSLEALSRADDAIREYRRALEIVPLAESATIALASLQFTRDDRDATVSLIDGVFNRKPSTTDPGRLASYGSFMRWPRLKARMREVLP
jgi:tetratricopeptide (TPR) repeat protein